MPLRPALRSYLRRLGFWLFAGGVFMLFAFIGAWPGGDEAAINPASEAATHWPRLGLALFALVVAGGWLVTRGPPRTRAAPWRLRTRSPGMAVALIALAVITLVLIVTNPHALLFVLPSAHAWLWLVQARGRDARLRAAALRRRPRRAAAASWARWPSASGIGLDTPWYLAELTALGYVSAFTFILVLAWAAVAAQVLAVTTGRYAPYPSAEARPARGAVGTAIASLRASWQR